MCAACCLALCPPTHPPIYTHTHTQAKQALRLGPEAFLASTLEAQEITLEELNIFAPTLKQFFKASKQFFEDTTSKWHRKWWVLISRLKGIRDVHGYYCHCTMFGGAPTPHHN